MRAKLGTGSPNTITRMLDAWWLGLAERLCTANELPNLPDEVGQAMTALWSQALEHARTHTQQEVRAERDALQQSRSALDAREAEQAAVLATAQGAAAEAEEAARRATVEATALRRLADRLESEAAEHAAERRRLMAQNEALEAACAELRDEIRGVEAKSVNERTARDDHLKVVEDRAHAEVDRARTELKAARNELAEVRKQHSEDERNHQQRFAELTRTLSIAEREGSRQRGIAEALTVKLGTRSQAKPRRKRTAKDAPRRARHAASR